MIIRLLLSLAQMNLIAPGVSVTGKMDRYNLSSTKKLSLVSLTVSAHNKMLSSTENAHDKMLTPTVSAHSKMSIHTTIPTDDEEERPISLENNRQQHLRNNKDTEKFLKNRGEVAMIARDLSRDVLALRENIDFPNKVDNLPTTDDDIEFKRHPSRNINVEVMVKKQFHHHLQPQVTRRANVTFAEDDTKNSFEGGTVSDFEKNLDKFKKNSSRRKKLPEDVDLFEDVVMLHVSNRKKHQPKNLKKTTKKP